MKDLRTRTAIWSTTDQMSALPPQSLETLEAPLCVWTLKDQLFLQRNTQLTPTRCWSTSSPGRPEFWVRVKDLTITSYHN